MIVCGIVCCIFGTSKSTLCTDTQNQVVDYILHVLDTDRTTIFHLSRRKMISAIVELQPPNPDTVQPIVKRKQDGGPDAGTSLPQLPPMERPAENALERGGKSDGMESGQMPTRASL